jgi:hypothetical protein
LAETNTPRDPEIIRREIIIADLSASNCALQADGLYKQIEALQLRAQAIKIPHDAHVARKAALEAELTEALKLPPLVL